MDLSVIGYDSTGYWQKQPSTVEELLECRNPSGMTWINVEGLEDSAGITRIAEAFHIHPLTVEDILNLEQRPKVEEFDHYLYLNCKSISQNALPGKQGVSPSITFECMSFIILDKMVISFQELPGDSFDGIRKRIFNNAGRIRRMGADYLVYCLVDKVVDDYFITLDDLEDRLEAFEDRAAAENDSTFVEDLQVSQRKLLKLRRVISPLRESLSTILHLNSPFISNDLVPFFKDVLENTIQASEILESYRDVLSGLMEVNLSVVSNGMNKIMKVLTIISTLFIPLTFIVGVYGMNFENMPELKQPLGYPLTWLVMVIIAGAMLMFFKRRRWI